MVCSTAGSSGSSTGAAAQAGQERVDHSRSRGWRARPGAGPRAVDDLVGLPGEAVQGVHVAAFAAGSSRVAR